MDNFMVLENPARSGGALLELRRTDGLLLLAAPADAAGQERIDHALEELTASNGAWLNCTSGHLPEWGQQLLPFLTEVRNNDWNFAPGSYVSQRHTASEISRGIPLRDLPEVYQLVGNLQEYTCAFNYLVLDREALELFIDLVPPEGNYLAIDSFIRQHGDRVARVSSVARTAWECVMHYCGEVRGPMPEGFIQPVPNLFVYPALKTFIVRGDLSYLLSHTRFKGTAVMQTFCRRSYEALLDDMITFAERKVA